MAGQQDKKKVVEKRKYRKKSEQKINKTKGVYFCIEDEGDGSGKCRIGFKSRIKNDVQSHQSHAHYK